MDEIDRAVACESLILEKQIQATRAGLSVRKINPRGSCHYCEEPFRKSDSRLFCDADCRDDHVKYSRQ